jgi:hypothetical protein
MAHDCADWTGSEAAGYWAFGASAHYRVRPCQIDFFLADADGLFELFFGRSAKRTCQDDRAFV